MLSASNNRVIVKDVDTGSRLYFDWPDFRAIFREVSK
jgi:hypothetical protein